MSKQLLLLLRLLMDLRAWRSLEDRMIPADAEGLLLVGSGGWWLVLGIDRGHARPVVISSELRGVSWLLGRIGSWLRRLLLLLSCRLHDDR
jgi:hypothetical protein